MKELLEKILGQIKKTPSGVRAYEDLYHICLETQKTDIPLSVEYLKKLSDIIENRIPQSETDKELRSLFMLHKKVLLAAAPFDFESYLLYVEWEREPDKKFYVPRREVMHPVVQAMQDLIDDRLDLLTISMPPGTGKSTLGIFFLSWVMGRFPDSQSLASAHSGMLTRSFYDGVYQIITDSEYLWADVFPGVKMAATNSKEETIDLHKKHRFSTLTCRAINASLTGATRCDKILYADDLCSGIEEAMSKERLDKLWSAYTNDLKSRKKEGAKEIHIATRWSVHDVIGRLENQYGGDSRAKFIVLPALDADGESNFNYTYGVGFSRHYFEDMRNNLDEASFKALFMNQPIEREGLLYDVDELRRYFELPAEDPDAIIGICDTKDKGSDYAFLPAAYVYGNDYYIDDCICDNSLPNIVDARLVDILLRCKVKMCRFESNSAGGRVAEKVQNEVKKRGGITRITTKFTTANKETKIIVNSAWVKEHCLFKDDSLYKRQSDYGRMMDMLGSYTGSSTSDTGSAVLLRDGWSDAEARAKDSENVFKRAEKKMLKLVLRICRDLGGLTLKLSDIDMKFTRRNYEAIQSKSQVLISMLQEPKIHPQLAFQHSGMFSDAESAYTMSMKYYEEQQEKAAELAKKTAPDDSGDDDNDPDNNDI